MKTRHIPSHESKNTNPSGLRPFAAVCAMALVACVTIIACSGRVASQAPLPMSHEPAPVALPSTSGDPSLPSAAQVLKGRLVDDSAEPAPTF